MTSHNCDFTMGFLTSTDLKSAIRSFFVAFTVLMLAVLAANPTVCAAKDKAAPGRLLTGKVLDKHDNAVVDAVVYLTNTRTHTVTTYIIGPDGTYRFPELSPNVEYELYAQFKGQKSDAKTVSQFDDRKQINIVLRIDVR